jgi:anaerobic magnesium-protoporphyrin IX monomethyl ester cyclase
MKISLIAVRPKHSSYGLFSIAPLGLLYLGTILKNSGNEVTVYDEARTNVYNEKKQKVRSEILKSDFIGISVISPAANRALAFLKTIKKLKPAIRTAVGGPHVLGEEQAKRFAQYADIIVKKEAENIIEKVVNGSLTGILEGSIVKDLDRLPIPDLNLLHYSKRKILDFFKLTPISTARGCPRNCEFCTVSNIHGKKVRLRSPELVMKELKQRDKEGYKRIFFVDDNFSVAPEKRKKLLELMAEERKKRKWFQSIIIQDEVPGILKGGDTYVRMLKDAGIKTVMLGVESFDDKKLQAMHKHHQKTDSEKAIRLIKKHGLIIYAFGMAKPEIDDKDSIRKQFEKLKKEGVSYADMTIETPVPGTTYWEKYKDQLTATQNGHPDWDKWTFLSTVIPTKKLSKKEFQDTVKKSMKNFYSPSRAMKDILKGKLRRGLTILYVWMTTGRMYV